MIWLYAGHNNGDCGAIANGVKEADLTKELRNLVKQKLDAKGVKVTIDDDADNLITTIKKTKSTENDVIIDIHFNSSASVSATGVETLIPDRFTVKEQNLAKIISAGIAKTLGIKDRGVKTEIDSHRGRLGILHPAGTNVLIEVCFISNLKDLQSYQIKKNLVADVIVNSLIGLK